MNATKLLLSGLGVSVALSAHGQETADAAEKELGWKNETELSLVVTSGNSETETFGLKNHLEHLWANSRYSLRLEGVRSESADPPFVQVIPNEDFTEVEIVPVIPDKELDVEKFLVENIYSHDVTERLFWNGGLTWDRNERAGILDRYVAFGGVGHRWWEREGSRLETTYGLSYTDRQETSRDPDKDETFTGLRLSLDFETGLGEVTTVGSRLVTNASLQQTDDWNGDLTTWVAVAVSRRVALKVSLQWLYANLPSLQSLDVVAELPDGVVIDFGSVSVPKERLDTLINSSVVIRF